MNTKHKLLDTPPPHETKPRYKGKYGGGPRFRRYAREEIVADSSIGYYRLRAFLVKIEAWRLHDIEKRLDSLLAWGAWRFNSEQKAEISNALESVRDDIKAIKYRTKMASQALRMAQQGKLTKQLPSASTLRRRRKETRERARKAVTDYYKKQA